MRKQKKEYPGIEHSQLPPFTERFRSLFRDNETQEEFGKRVGLTRNTVAQYYNGHRIPDSIHLRKICEKCSISSDWLLGLSDIKKPDASAQGASKYTGLSETALDTIRSISEGDWTGNEISALSKALESKALLDIIVDYMFVPNIRGYCEDHMTFEDGTCQITTSLDGFASFLKVRIIDVLEAVRTGNNEALRPYLPYKRQLAEWAEKAREYGSSVFLGSPSD